MVRDESAVLADDGAERRRPHALRQLDDLVLVESHQRSEHRNRGGVGDANQVGQGLGGDLAQALAGDQGIGVALARDGLGGAEHQALEQHLPVARLGVGLDLPRNGIEVHRVEERRVAVGPALRDQLHHAQHAELVGAATQVEEHVVESHAAPEQLPRRDRRVVAARDEREGASLGPDRQAPGAAPRLETEVGGAAVELDGRGRLGMVEVHSTGAGRQRPAQLALDVARAEGRPLPVADHARPHCVVALQSTVPVARKASI